MKEEKSQKQLLKFKFQVPPKDDEIYSQKIKFWSSPLEITYDKRTVNAVSSMFKVPEEINLDYLGSKAFAKLEEYRQATALTIDYIIENHQTRCVDVRISSSRIIIPQSGEHIDNCACSVLNLGKISTNISLEVLGYCRWLGFKVEKI